MGRMKNLVYFSGAALSVIALAIPAAAQSQSASSTYPLRFRIGSLQLSNSKAREYAGSRIYGAQVDLVPSKGADASALTIGYFEGRRNGKSLRVAPLLVTKSTDTSAPVSNLTGFYSSSGFGAYFIDAAGSGYKAKLGGFFGFGLRLSGGVFVEAQYLQTFGGSVNGATPNGVGIFIGRRG
jgi:hypothetical protein